MNKNLGIIIAIVIIAVGGFFLYSNQRMTPQDQPSQNVMVSPSPTITEVDVVLLEQNNSQEMGTATLKEMGGKVIVTLSLTGALAGVMQPAHIHVGACPTPGAIKYPLVNAVNGQSETTLDVTLSQLKKEQPLAINVHKSVQEASVYVSCGDLKIP